MSLVKEYLAETPVLTRAVVGYLIKDDQVLLGLRKKVSLGLGENLIAGIGGKVEGMESEEEAFKREVEEEIKVKILSCKEMGKVTFLFPHKPVWNQIVDVFISEEWKGEPTETEPIKPMWFSKTKLPIDQMWPDNKIWLPLVLKGKNVNGVFLYSENGEVLKHTLEIE